MSPKDVLQNLQNTIPSSKYFTWSEALYLPKMEAIAVPSQEVVNNIIKMAGNLDKIRAFYNKPLIISSWYRPTMYNKLIGGAQYSQHMNGLAVDFIIPSKNPVEVQQELLKREDIWPYRIELDTPTWIHVDLLQASGIKRGFRP